MSHVGTASMSQSQSQLSILALLVTLFLMIWEPLGISNFQQQAHLCYSQQLTQVLISGWALLISATKAGIL